MILIPGRIPIYIHPFFWLCAGLISWMNSPVLQAGPLIGTLIWIAIIFVSVLFHEFGHAIIAVLFKQKASIQLVALGGLTSYEGPKLKYWKQFLIVLSGPLFGLSLCFFSGILLQFDWSAFPLLRRILWVTQFANLFWSIVNLLPVLPLDGGQLLRIALESRFGLKGYKASMLIGAGLATLLALFSFLVQQIFIGAIFFLFAFQSFDLWRKSRSATTQDRDEEMGKYIAKGEQALQEGKKGEAESIFLAVMEKTKDGILHRTAIQYLAFLKLQKGEKEEAYSLLLPIEQHLADDIRCLLHQLAAEHQNWTLVAKLSATCYQISQDQQTALRNARAFAFLQEPKPAGGWLQTAWRQGGFDLEKVLNEVEFQAIRKDPEFERFINSIQ